MAAISSITTLIICKIRYEKTIAELHKELIDNLTELVELRNARIDQLQYWIDLAKKDNILTPDILGACITEPEEVLHENHGGC